MASDQLKVKIQFSTSLTGTSEPPVHIERIQRQPSCSHVTGNENEAKQCGKSLIVLDKREFLHCFYAKSSIERFPRFE
jgi:hypothetical protein